MFMQKLQQNKNKSHLTSDFSSVQLHQQKQVPVKLEDKKQKLFTQSIQHQANLQSIQSLPEKVISKKNENQRKVASEEQIINHCTCCPFYNTTKQRKQLDKITKQIIFMEDDFDTYLLHQEKQNEQNKVKTESKKPGGGVYFSKNELEFINQGPLPKKLNLNSSKINSEVVYQQQHNASQVYQQLQQHPVFKHARLQGEEEEFAQKRKNFYVNTGHNRTNSYDSYAHAASKQWLEQISEEREEQESQLTFKNKHLNHASSSQNLRSENRFLINSNRNSICNNGNGSNTRRSSASGGDNNHSLASLYSQQNQLGFQHSQQNTPQISANAPSQASSSTYMPQYSLNFIEPRLDNSEFGSTHQLSVLELQPNGESLTWQTQRKRNQHFRSQSCPYSIPYFKYTGQNQQNEDGSHFNGQNIRVMTIHEEEPYHNYVNTSSYQYSSNNSTRNKYRQQQPYRQNTNYRSASGGDFSNSNRQQNLSFTPNTIVHDKNLQMNTNAQQFPYTNTPFCFDNQNVNASNLQADENQYLYESFHTEVYDGDNRDQLSAVKDKVIINRSNKASLEKFEKENDNESMREGRGQRIKSQGLHIPQIQNIQTTKNRGPSLANEFANNSNSQSMNMVKSFNQLDTDQGFISFRNEHSCSSQQEEGIVDNFRSSINSIDFDLKQKIKENIDKINKRQVLKRQNRLRSMVNCMQKQSDKEIQDLLLQASHKSVGKNLGATNSFSICGGSSSGKKLPTIPLLQSYQGSANSHSSTLSSTLFQAYPYQQGKTRSNNNFWSYDFTNGNKSFLSNETSLPFKKGGEEENSLRKAIEDGFMKNQLLKGRSSSHIINHHQIQDPKAMSLKSISQINEKYAQQPTAKFINEKNSLQLPQNLPLEDYKKMVNQLSTAPASLQFYQNKDSRYSNHSNNSQQMTLNNFDMKTSGQSAQGSSLPIQLNAMFSFNNYNNEMNNGMTSSSNMINNNNSSSTILPINNQISNNFNNQLFNNNSVANMPEQNQQNQHAYQSINTPTLNPANHQLHHPFNSSIQSSLNNTSIPHVLINNNSINNNSHYPPQKNNSYVHNTQQNSIPKQYQNNTTHQQSAQPQNNNASASNQQQNNISYPQTPPTYTVNNGGNIANTSVNHNTINTGWLNRISEECESPANTTYKQQQEYLNYESEQYLTGSKSKYHQKQQQVGSYENSIKNNHHHHSNNQPIEENVSSQQIQLFDKHASNNYSNQDKQQLIRIERFSSPKQMQQISHTQNQYSQGNNLLMPDPNQQSQTHGNITTMFNLLNHTIANPNNLNQSHQQNPSANNSWFESSRSYEILMLEENKARSYIDAQMLSFSKTKNAPSSHLSSQKSLQAAANSNMLHNQEINDQQNNTQNINSNFTVNQQNNSITSSQSRGVAISGDNSPNKQYLTMRNPQNNDEQDQSQNLYDDIEQAEEGVKRSARKKEFDSSPSSQKNKKHNFTLNNGFHYSQIGKINENKEKNKPASSPQRLDQIIQSLTKSLNQYSLQKDLQEATGSAKSTSSQQQNQASYGQSRKSIDQVLSPYLQKFPSKISEEQSKMLSSGSNFNTSNNNNQNHNVTNNNNQNKMMASSNQFSNASQYLNTQHDNNNANSGGVIQSGIVGDYINFDSSKSLVQTVRGSNKPCNNLTNPTPSSSLLSNQNQFVQNSNSNVNLPNNHFNIALSHHNIHANNNANNIFTASQRSSSGTSNSNYNIHENQGFTSASKERTSEPRQSHSIEIQIQRVKQNNHTLLISALRKQLQVTKPQIFAEIEEHIRLRPHLCFILVLQEDQPERAVLKAIFEVYNQSMAKLSYQIEEIPNIISIEDVDSFLKIDSEDFSFKLVDEPSSLKKVDGVILFPQYS